MEAIINGSGQPSARANNGLRWTARILGALVVLFLLADGAGKVLKLAPYVEGTAKLGFPPGSLVPMGIALLACTILYVIPRTAVLGAVLLTGYFGGAVATMVHAGQPFVFPLVCAAIVWGALVVLDSRARRAVELVFGR